MHQYEVFLLENNKFKLLEPYINSKTPVMMKCLECETEVKATPLSKKHSFTKYGVRGCKVCESKGRQSDIDYPSFLRDNNRIELLEPFNGALVLHKMQCLVCSHEWEDKPSNKKEALKRNKSGCPQCDVKIDGRVGKVKVRLDYAKVLNDNNRVTLLESIKDPTKHHKLQCQTCNHIWSAAPATVKRGFDTRGTSGCPECARMKSTASIDTFTTFLRDNNKIQLLEPYKGSKKHHDMMCLVCSHQWSATPLSKKQAFVQKGNRGCPQCDMIRKAQDYSDIRNANIETLRRRGIEVLTPDYEGTREYGGSGIEKIHVRNIKCGHSFWSTPTNLLEAATDCAICGPKRRVELITAMSKRRAEEWRETATDWQIYKSDVTRLTELEYVRQYDRINPNQFPRTIAGVLDGYQLDHIIPKRFCFEWGVPPEDCADVDNLQMIRWEDNNRCGDILKGAIPKKIAQHLPESNIIDLTSKLSQRYPNMIEYCKIGEAFVSLYDESNNHAILIIPIDRTYANMKTAEYVSNILDAERVSYSIIFEDELANNFDLVCKKLNHYMKRSELPKIHGRKCSIRKIDASEKNAFLDKNHIQGKDAATISLGAVYGDKLVAVMTFAKPRVALGMKGPRAQYEGFWELSRFATDNEYRIPGIASKLLAHFKRNWDWNGIYSYADKRWSVGNMYEVLGFTQAVSNKPDYQYIINGVRKHRWNYRKDRLKETMPFFDPELTEYENMVKNGYWRVWDCGTLKFTISRDCAD